MGTEIERVALTPHTPAGTADDEALLRAWMGDLKPTTRAAYAKDLKDFLGFAGRHRPGVDATADWFFRLGPAAAHGLAIEYRADQLARGLAAATIARRLAAVRSLVKLARTLGRVNWSLEVSAPKPEPRRDMSGPDEGELKKLVRAAKRGSDPRAKRDRSLLSLLYGMALRRGEVTALDLADLDFARGVLAVLRKGRREKVALEMPPEVSRDLAEWVAARGPHPGPLFHGTRAGKTGERKPLSGESIRRAVAAVSRAAKLDKTVRPHGLRHSFATIALERGETIQDVMVDMGHSRPETTARYFDAMKKGGGKVRKKSAKLLG